MKIRVFTALPAASLKRVSPSAADRPSSAFLTFGRRPFIFPGGETI